MSDDQDRARFAERIRGYVSAAMPGAAFLDLAPVLGEDSVSMSAYDEDDRRPAAEIVAALDAAVRADGWRSVRSGDGATAGLNVARDRVGGGVFGVQTGVVSFTGVPDYGEPGPAAAERPGPTGRQLGVSRDIRAAIRSAAPGAVHPRDDFDGDRVRVAGWDPDGRGSDEALLGKAGAFLAGHGWQVTPDMWTDSDDRSAVVAKPGLAAGRLLASDGGLTFVGSLTGG
ncbi:hypothetical protein OG900_32375 [Streptomyces sp. NBC_00433]